MEAAMAGNDSGNGPEREAIRAIRSTAGLASRAGNASRRGTWEWRECDGQVNCSLTPPAQLNGVFGTGATGKYTPEEQ